MEDPYRTTCAKCAELTEDVTEYRSDNQVLRDDNEKLRLQLRSAEVKTWSSRIVTGLITGACIAGAGLMVPIVYAWALKPSTPDPCVDSTNIISYQNGAEKCSPGAIMETEILTGEQAGKVLVTCRCNPKEKSQNAIPDAGAAQ